MKYPDLSGGSDIKLEKTQKFARLPRPSLSGILHIAGSQCRIVHAVPMETRSHDSVQITSMISMININLISITSNLRVGPPSNHFLHFQGFRRRPQLQAAGRVARPRSMGDTSILTQKKVKNTILVFFSIFLKSCYTQSFPHGK